MRTFRIIATNSHIPRHFASLDDLSTVRFLGESVKDLFDKLRLERFKFKSDWFITSNKKN